MDNKKRPGQNKRNDNNKSNNSQKNRPHQNSPQQHRPPRPLLDKVIVPPGGPMGAQGYGPPGGAQGYGPPGGAPGYGPPGGQWYGPPAGAPGYVQPAPGQWYGPPAGAPAYGPPAAGAYWQPPQGQAYGPPGPQGQPYGPPGYGHQQSHGGPPPPYDAGAPKTDVVQLSRSEYDKLTQGVDDMDIKSKPKSGGPRHSNQQASGSGRSTPSADVKPKFTRPTHTGDIKADIEKVQICIYSITNTCRVKQCERLHAKFPVHWQFKKGKNWYNFREFHSKELEKSYLKPESDGVALSKLNDNVPKLMRDLLGDKTFVADFVAMNMTNVQNNKYNIRRVSTQSSAMSGHSMATVYDWFFRDEYNKWIKYGQPSTRNEARCVPTVTSEDIEEKYIKEKVDSFEFSSSLHGYVIDFIAMTQTNKSTKVARELRRRPKKRPIMVASDVDKAMKSGKMPNTWIPMASSQIFMKVKLEPMDTEYQFCVMSMKKDLPNINVGEVHRIQSPYLWLAFQNKKEYIKTMNNVPDITEEFLFHGTDNTNLDAICEQNLDWRLHGSNVGQMYGRGSYFSNSSAYADRYTRPSASAGKTMLVVRVLVGTITQGNSKMTRPPVNPLSGHLFDTTVNNEANPTIYVKYDTQEYYPEYVVNYT